MSGPQIASVTRKSYGVTLNPLPSRSMVMAFSTEASSQLFSLSLGSYYFSLRVSH